MALHLNKPISFPLKFFINTANDNSLLEHLVNKSKEVLDILLPLIQYPMELAIPEVWVNNQIERERWGIQISTKKNQPQ